MRRYVLPIASLILAGTFGTTYAFGTQVLYVDDDAPVGGDGLSWATAYDSLDIALTGAESGDQIWVAAGRYVGNFTLALKVELYGGFAGTETELAQRDWEANPTILDGNQTGSVVTSPVGATETTRIDGFTITNGSGTVSGLRRDGGGLYLSSSSPTIANNTITYNSANTGGGLYLLDSSPTISHNAITRNNSESFGGGLYLSSSYPMIASNTITYNSATSGGGLYLLYSSPTIAHNAITGNRADGAGGGMCNMYGAPALTDCTFSDNQAGVMDEGFGGGMYNHNGDPTLMNCTFRWNSAGLKGGGMFNWSGDPTLVDCTFVYNSATDLGGGVINYYGSPKLINCAFTANRSRNGHGGGMLNEYGDPTLTNCTFNRNWAYLAGGGMCNGEGSPILMGCTFNSNSVAGAGGGMYFDDGAPTLTNCILWGNTRGDGVRDQAAQISDMAGVTYSCIEGWEGAGTGNIGDDPLFIDPDGPDDTIGTSDDNLRVLPFSPVIDTGKNDAPELPRTDLDGHARILCEVVDMGAYEFGIGDHDCDQNIDLTDFTAWEACMTGPDNGPYDPECEPFDFEYDDDVDMADFAGFANVLTGPR